MYTYYILFRPPLRVYTECIHFVYADKIKQGKIRIG